MTLQEFINKYTGVPNVGDTAENNGQCVGLIEVWIDVLGLPHVWGNAKDLLTNAQVSAFDIIHNSPTNAPLPGDIIVWDHTWGNGYGHTGIVVSADQNTFTALEQNNPAGSAPKQVHHDSYMGVLGWLHPKVTIQAPVDQQKIIDDLRAARDTNYNNYTAEVTKNTELTNHINDLQAQIADLQGQVNDFKQKYEDEQKHTIELNTELEAANAQMAQIKGESKDYAIQTLDAQHQADEAQQQLQQTQQAQAKQVESALQLFINKFIHWKK